MALYVNNKGELVTNQLHQLVPVNGFCFNLFTVQFIIKKFGHISNFQNPETIIYSIDK